MCPLPLFFEAEAVDFVYHLAGQVYVPTAFLVRGEKFLHSLIAKTAPDGLPVHVPHPRSKGAKPLRAVPEAIALLANKSDKGTMAKIHNRRNRLLRFRAAAADAIRGTLHATHYCDNIEAAMHAFRAVGTTPARAALFHKVLTQLDTAPKALRSPTERPPQPLRSPQATSSQSKQQVAQP
jgi:hypothetical protein